MNEDLLAEFEKIYAFLKEEANITLQLKESNTHESGSLAFYVNYIGPLQGSLTSRDIKIDITRKEVLEFPAVVKKVFILYSDLPEESFSLKCYSLEEILIEKMAALMGRTEPRDFYYFWHLTENKRLETGHLKPEFERKAKNKGHDYRLFEQKVMEKEKNLSQAWQRKLQDQVYDLPKFADVFRESKRHFRLQALTMTRVGKNTRMMMCDYTNMTHYDIPLYMRINLIYRNIVQCLPISSRDYY